MCDNNCHITYYALKTLEEQYFIDSELKGEVISSKIDQLAAINTLKFKWAWRAQFLSQTLQILEINLSFEAVKLIYYTLSKSHLVSDIKKMKKSSLSVYRDLHE